MLKKFFAATIATLFSISTIADVINLSDDAPKVYIVKKGDTLWDIAKLYLNDPWHWPTLWKNNPKINNPDLIYPNDILRLIYQDGKPVLQHIGQKNNAESWPINGVSQSFLRQYLTYDTLIDKQDFDQAPRVLGSQEGWHYLSKREPFYIDSETDEENWFVYRAVSEFDRQYNGKLVKMVSLKKVAQARLISKLDNMSEMQLIEQLQEIKPNDILLPEPSMKTGDIFHPRAAQSGLTGNMIGHLYGSKYIGLRQIVVLDIGAKDGLVAGDILSAQFPGSSLKGVKGKMRYISNVDNNYEPIERKLPSRLVGTLLVIKSYPHFSLAMVAKAEQPLFSPMIVTSAG